MLALGSLCVLDRDCLHSEAGLQDPGFALLEICFLSSWRLPWWGSSGSLMTGEESGLERQPWHGPPASLEHDLCASPFSWGWDSKVLHPTEAWGFCPPSPLSTQVTFSGMLSAASRSLLGTLFFVLCTAGTSASRPLSQGVIVPLWGCLTILR